MSLFPHDDKARKMLPVFKMITGYFPKALREVTRVCVANNVRYNPDRDPADINWARGKSKDQLGCLLRHIMERQVDGTIFEETSPEVVAATGIARVYVLAEAAWRALAALEEEVESQEKDLNSALTDQVAARPVPEVSLSECICGASSTLAPVHFQNCPTNGKGRGI